MKTIPWLTLVRAINSSHEERISLLGRHLDGLRTRPVYTPLMQVYPDIFYVRMGFLPATLQPFERIMTEIERLCTRDFDTTPNLEAAKRLYDHLGPKVSSIKWDFGGYKVSGLPEAQPWPSFYRATPSSDMVVVDHRKSAGLREDDLALIHSMMFYHIDQYHEDLRGLGLVVIRLHGTSSNPLPTEARFQGRMINRDFIDRQIREIYELRDHLIVRRRAA